MARINTKRLILRKWEEKDLEPFARLNQDQKVLEFLPGALIFEESAEWVKRSKQHFKEHGFGLWVATLKTGEFIGYIGLNVTAFEAHFTPSIGIEWRLSPEYWNHGYATEGAQAVLKYAFDELGLKELVSFTVPANTRSTRVMEKIGMKRDLSGDFHHPKLSKNHPLSLHALYRVKNESHNILFKNLNEDDLKLLHQWFQIPHILKWYALDKKYSLEEIQEKYLPRIKDQSIPSFIVYDQDKPVGYIQYYHVTEHYPEGIVDYTHPLFNHLKPSELAGIDLFIADENYLHRGFSSNVLKTFINKYLKNHFQAILVDPNKNNITAINFFENNGFEKVLSENEQHHLMLKHIVDDDMAYTISYDPAPKNDDTKIIWEGISEHASKARGLPPGKPFAFFIRDEHNQIKGGCSGYIYYGCLYVDLLWVDESLRGKQYGNQLMRDTEKLANDNHCNFIAVNTMDFEALDFYIKLGFTVEFERKGFDKNSIMYFLRKDLGN